MRGQVVIAWVVATTTACVRPSVVGNGSIPSTASCPVDSCYEGGGGSSETAVLTVAGVAVFVASGWLYRVIVNPPL